MHLDNTAYKKGFLAGENNQSLDSCRYLITVKRIAWMAGYQDGKSCAERRKGIFDTKRTPEDRERGNFWLSQIKQKVITGSTN